MSKNITRKEIVEFILIFGVGFIVTHIILSAFSTIKPFDRFLFRSVFFMLFVLCVYSLKKIFDLEKRIHVMETKFEKKEEEN